MATADEWRAWTRDILEGEEPASTRATRALCDAARRDGRLAMRKGWNTVEAATEDYVQEVLAVSWQKILQAENPRAFFMISVRRKAIDRHRRIGKRETSLEALAVPPPARRGAPSHEARSEVTAVLAFLEASLSPRDLRVFEARAVLGLSSKDVAEQQGLSPANVDQIVSRTRRRLQEHFRARS